MARLAELSAYPLEVGDAATLTADAIASAAFNLMVRVKQIGMLMPTAIDVYNCNPHSDLLEPSRDLRLSVDGETVDSLAILIETYPPQCPPEQEKSSTRISVSLRQHGVGEKTRYAMPLCRKDTDLHI